MSSPAKRSNAEALSAAAVELKRRRAAGTATETPPPKPGKPGKPGKAKKVKTVRCSVRLPEGEYRELAKIRKRLGREGVSTKKGELVRAGLMLLVLLDRTDLKAAIRDVIAPEPATHQTP